MNPFAAFILGLVVGWVVEWVIDWVYWRRRTAETRRRLELAESRLTQAEADLKKSEGGRVDLENQMTALKADYARLQEKAAVLEGDRAGLQEKVAMLEAEKPSLAGETAARETVIPVAPVAPEVPADEVAPATPAAAVVPDDLVVIRGIGPVIARKLNEAGIYTFQELGALTPQRLREIVGDVIQRLADEEKIISQAQELAAQHNQASKV